MAVKKVNVEELFLKEFEPRERVIYEIFRGYLIKTYKFTSGEADDALDALVKKGKVKYGESGKIDGKLINYILLAK